LQSDINDLNSQINSLNSDKSTKQNLQTKKNNLINSLNDLNTQISNLNTLKPQVESDIFILETNKTEVTNKGKEVDEKIVKLDNDNNTIKIEITTKQTELDGVNEEINATSDKLSSIS
jgi:chromosome segregation ATPase